MTNVEQRERWNQESGEIWVRLQQQFDGTLAPWLELLRETAGITDGERVLDVGCGTGATTLDAARCCAPSGSAVGLDLSEPMVARARERAREDGVDNVHFVVGDAQVDELTLDGPPHDVVLSRFGIMFFDDPVAAFANIAQATRPGGRLVGLTWTALAEQEWLMVPAAPALTYLPMPDLGGDDGPGMFSMADPDHVAAILRDAGWSDVTAERHTLRAPLGGPGTVDDAMAFLLATGPGRAMFEDAEPELAAKAQAAIRTTLAEHLTPTGVELGATAWLVTARR